LRNESGATAIEYAMIASLVSVIIVVAVTSIGTKLSGFFNSLVAYV
jgi:pilus assembly protein Flp/PilA